MENLKNLWATQNITHCYSTFIRSDIFNNAWSAVLPFVSKVHKLKWSQIWHFCYNWTYLACCTSCSWCWSWYDWFPKECTRRSILCCTLLIYIEILNLEFAWWSCSCCRHQSLWSVLFSHGCLLALGLFNFVIIV